MDFRVIGDTYRYGVRVSAIVVKDGKLLTYKVEDQNHLVGGAILVGEASRKAVAREVKEELGVDVSDQDFLPFQDIEESVREDMQLLIESPLIPDDVIISGAIYDVDTGSMTVVEL